MEFSNYIEHQDFDGLETFIQSIFQIKGKKVGIKLVERTLNYYATNQMFQRFFTMYEKQNPDFRENENILCLVINCYYLMNDFDNMMVIINTLISKNQLKRRHIIFVIEFLMKNDIDKCYELINTHHSLLKMEDFQDFFNVCFEQNKMDLIMNCLELIKDKPYIFNNLPCKTCTIIDGKCSDCKSNLYYKRIDFSKFIDKITSEINKSDVSKFFSFIKKNDYDVVVDTANIFYYTLNKHNPQINSQSFQFLSVIIENLKKYYNNILLIIHKRHSKLLTQPRFSEYRKLFESNLTYWTPYGMNDDYFSLLACWVKYPVPIVTQDLFRDHKFFIDDDDIFQWYQDMNIKYYENGEIIPIKKYSVIIQKNESKWHIPYKNYFICF